MTCPLCHSPDPDHREVHDCPMPSYARAEILRLRSQSATLVHRQQPMSDLQLAGLSCKQQHNAYLARLRGLL